MVHVPRNRGGSIRSRGAVALAASALLLAGCGNQLSHERLLADARGGDVAATGNASVDAGATGGSDGAGATGQATAPGVGTAAGGSTSGGSTGGSTSTRGSLSGSSGSGTGTVGATTGGSTTSTSGGTGAAGQACAGRKSTINIGTVGQQTGVLGAALVNGTKAVQAWVASVNAAGGVGCHPLKYIVADDGGDPSRHLSLVQQLVEQKGVVAFIYQDALLTGQASAKYVQQKGIPVIGQDGGEMHTYDAPNFFNHDTSAAPLFDMTIAAGAKVAIPQGKRTLGSLVCQEVAGCATAESRFHALAPALGFTSVYKGRASLATVDFTSQCISARNAKVDALAVSFDSTGIHRIAQSCASVGYHPLIICTSVQANLDFKDDANLAGAVVAQPLLPWFLTKEPAIQKYQATLSKYAPGLPFDPSSLNGWGAAQLFSLATKAFASDTVTSSGIIAALAAVKNNDLGGLTYPLSFAPGKPQAKVVCGWVVTVGSGKFNSDGKRFCR